MSQKPLIELRNLTKTYIEGDREQVILRDVSDTIGEGEFIVLLGRSGSGKSTFLNLVSGIDLPTSGEILFAGASLTGLPEYERTIFRRRHIGFIFQYYNLIPTLSVEENLLLPLELNRRIGGAERHAALAVLDELGLGDRATSFPDRLSGGEQQRVAIARALLHDPSVVLADEPTGNLDLETARDVLDLLDRRVRALGKTLIMVTHSSEVVGFADRILTIENGQLIDTTGPA